MRASWALALAAVVCVAGASPVYYDSTRWDPPGSGAAGWFGDEDGGEAVVARALFHSVCVRALLRRNSSRVACPGGVRDDTP